MLMHIEIVVIQLEINSKQNRTHNMSVRNLSNPNRHKRYYNKNNNKNLYRNHNNSNIIMIIQMESTIIHIEIIIIPKINHINSCSNLNKSNKNQNN